MKPIVMINLKTYKQGTGKEGLALVKTIAKVAKDYDVEMVVCSQMADICRHSQICACESKEGGCTAFDSLGIEIYSQTIEPIKFGSNTGHELPETIKEAGAVGTLLNHSEHRERIDHIESCISRAREVGLKIVVCANTAHIAEAIAAFSPDFVAVEPPELIGGDVSVSKAKPELITDTVDKVNLVNKNVGVLVGAGIKNAEDLRIALKLGARGVLLASGVVCSADPEGSLRGLLEGLKG
ncbi:triose-phosphate isomerase [Candidatus Woesearchaeota archaeon CG11_big_fil_rev_8_21_14_0_20_43_8]|nr:MAG: triose-phosphate isomerase [Candidatus Woesearchaeota archaeon CG11_big_fil_rev_8_21_14_0_20_43_8]PIO05686.1 MAG: triose-phosphate isomerase [Candidatus Woesearchaeota archaeon CG08_land_8_20_14_0_20_43_7]